MFNIISIIGPSGCGKTTIQKYLDIKPIVTYTSREPRDGEFNGEHYHFATRDRILEMKDKGYLLEYTEYNGNLYASDLHSINEAIENGSTRSIVVDASGARVLKKAFNGRILFIGVLASKDECIQRISSRNDCNTQKRLASYDYEVEDMIEICDIIINNSEEKWSQNRKILNWIRSGLMKKD